MKFGFRTPNFKKSLKARTTGKLKRSIKRKINPFYGKKGIGYIKNPKKAFYNKVYNKVTIDPLKPIKKKTHRRTNNTTKINTNDNKKEISIPKIILAICTYGISLLFTGIHKNKNK